MFASQIENLTEHLEALIQAVCAWVHPYKMGVVLPEAKVGLLLGIPDDQARLQFGMLCGKDR